jgi:hypothetical protein
VKTSIAVASSRDTILLHQKKGGAEQRWVLAKTSFAEPARGVYVVCFLSFQKEGGDARVGDC